MQLHEFPATPFTTAEARDLGISRKRLMAAVEEKLVRRAFHGVYLRADLPDSIENRAACAARVIASGSVVRDRSAAVESLIVV
jgi:hypothetical protein